MSAVLALPRVVVETEGAPIGRAAAGSLAQVVVQRSLSVPAQCELTFVDPSLGAAVATDLAPGRSLTVRLAEREEALFEGETTAVEHVYDPSRGREVRVRGYDRLHRLRKRQAARAYLDLTTADLAAEMAATIGLVVSPSDSGPTWPRILQHRQSDLELLVDVCHRSSLYLTVDAGTLYLITLEGIGEPVVLTLGSSLLEASIEVNGDRAVRTVAASGWDLRRIERHEAEASIARSGRTARADVPPESVGGSGRRQLFDEGTGDDDVALALAQAELDRRAAGEVVVRGVAVGDARLRPGAVVEIANVEASLDGRYVVTEVRHTVDRETGHLSQFSSEPPKPPRRARGATTTAGIVRRVDDPDELGRVEVVLPSFGDIETGWIPVVTMGAGPNKGVIALPDAGDRVLVLLAGEDPAQAVVLGGLFGPDRPFDAGVSGGETRRYSLRTKGGHLVRLDDEEQRLRLEDGKGNFVELSPEAVSIGSQAAMKMDARDRLEMRTEGELGIESTASLSIRSGAELEIHAAGDLVIEAPGRSIKIRAASIDFETA